MASRPILGSVRFGFSRVSSVQAFLVARRFDGDRPVLFGRRLRPVPHPARFLAAPLRCSLCLPRSSRCRRVPGGLPIRLPLRHRPSVTCFQRLLARRFAARRKALPVSGGADVDPLDNVYFPRRVSTHARLPLRILPRVLRRFARPRSTARNPRKGASRL